MVNYRAPPLTVLSIPVPTFFGCARHSCLSGSVCRGFGIAEGDFHLILVGASVLANLREFHAE
jgi:hypothetical protein